MAFYNYFWDLESSQSYTTHFVGQFDQNTNTGGGIFRWVNSNNASITNIPGYRIKPTSTTVGYWQRVIDGPWSVDWFGVNGTSTQSTLGSYGFTTAQLNTRYNGFGGSNTVTTADTYDTAAIKTAFNLMEGGYFFSLQFGQKEYYLTSTCYLPRRASSTTVREYDMYKIEGNGAQMNVHSTVRNTSFDMWSRVINNQIDAKIQVNTLFQISNLLFKGYQINAATPSVQNGIHLKCSYNSELNNLQFTHLNIGLHLRFCLGATVSRTMSIAVANEVIWVDAGDNTVSGGWSGTTYSAATSQSNSVEIYKPRHFCQFNTATSIKVSGCSGVVIDQPVIEGAQQSRGIWFDSLGVTAVKDFTVRRAHIETTFVNEAIYLQGGNNSQTIIEGIFSQYNAVMVHSNCDYGGYNNTIVRDIAYITPASTFKSTGAGTGNQWLFEYARSVNPLDPARWTGTMPSSATWTASGTTAGSSDRLREMYPFYVR